MAALSGVGKTAVGVARVRAAETKRPDRLFEDPYAARFVAASGVTFPEGRTGRGSMGTVFAAHTVLRTRFFDDYLLAATADRCAQVVLLAAGLDARAYRLDFPAGTTVFEVDMPDMLAFKDQVLAGEPARCARVPIAADLREDWAASLRSAGFRADVPTAWLAEGLLVYLSADEAARLLTTVGELSAPGSQISFEHAGVARKALLDEARKIPGMAEYAALWRGGLGERTPDWLARDGWTVEITERGEFAEAHGRGDPEQRAGTSGFLTARR